MKKVIEGVLSFQKEGFEDRRALFAELASGQNPRALFVTCADSRIDPNLVTRTDPGDLFIVRNAGNIVPPHTRHAGGVTASIEYAVCVLGVRNIIICGHTDCGAMKGAMDLEALAELPHVRDWLEHSRAAVEIAMAQGKDDDLLERVTEHNVVVQLGHLRTHPVIAALSSQDKIWLHAWVYHIETGEVTAYDEQTRSFRPLAEHYEEFLAES